MPLSFSYVEAVTIHANQKGKRVGKVLITFDETPDAVLDDLQVPKELEGQGVGRSLLSDAIRLAEQRGKGAIYTNPSAYLLGPRGQQVSDPDGQERLERFYRRNGFEEDDEGGHPAGAWVRRL
jgi:GNAT superfamily N-acetyltransferase